MMRARVLLASGLFAALAATSFVANATHAGFTTSTATGGSAIAAFVGGIPVTDGLVLELQADALTLTDGDPVASWPDTSGHSNDAEQPVASTRPTFTTDAANTLPAVRFDGGDQLLVPQDASLEPDALSLFAVVNVDSASADAASGLISTADVDSFTPGYTIFHRADVWEFRIASGDWSDATGAGKPRDQTVVLAATYDSGSQQQTLYQNGTELASAGGQALSFNNNPLQIGSWFSDRAFTGDIAAVALYDRALPAAEREQVEGYLEDKWLGVAP